MDNMINNIYIRCITVVLFLIALSQIYNFYLEGTSPTDVRRDITEKNLEIIKLYVKRDLSLFFKEINQSKEVQQQMQNQLFNLFPYNPSRPSVLFILFSEDSTKTAVCFAQKLQEIVSRAFEDEMLVSFPSEDFHDINGTSVKHSLDEKLSNLINNHVAILHNLDQLPPEAAMLLHAYCDNENAPYKRALIMLTMKSSSSYESLSKGKVRAIVDDTLRGLWEKKIKDDDIPAILSRITNAVVLIKPETKEVIATVCPEQKEL